MGALVAVQLTETLVEEMATKVEKITFWSDSITVLHYICQTSSPYKAFVKFNLSTLSTNNVFHVWNRLRCLHDHVVCLALEAIMRDQAELLNKIRVAATAAELKKLLLTAGPQQMIV